MDTRLRQLVWRLPLLFLLLQSIPSFACAVRGVCDLTEIDWDSAEPLALDGEWNFYWKEFVDTAAVASGEKAPTGFLSPGGDWGGVVLNGVSLNRQSHASYHVTFVLKESRYLQLRLPSLSSASRIWLNGNLIRSAGRPAAEPRDEIPGIHSSYLNFEGKAGPNTITVHVSSYNTTFLAGGGRFRIASIESLSNYHKKQLVIDSVTFGSILIMGFYHFYLWFLRRTRLEPLYFGIFCLGIALRSLVSGNSDLASLFLPTLPLELRYKLEYQGIAIGCLTTNLLVQELYRREYPRWLCRIFAGYGFCWLLLIVFSNATVYPRLLFISQIVLAISLIVCLNAILLAIYRKRAGAPVFLAGFLVVFTVVVLDILASQGVIHMKPLTHFGVFIFVFFQATILSQRFDKAFDKAETAEREVRALNESLEHKVTERTNEINTILSNVTSGFLAVDTHGNILPGFTQSCHSLLNAAIEPGKPFLSYLQLESDARSHFRESMVQVFEDIMPAAVTLSQIPSRLQMGNRTLSITGVDLRDEVGRIKAVLFTINDATSLQAAEREVKYNGMLIKILGQRESFTMFLKDFHLDVERGMEASRAGDQPKARMLLHTLKGNLASFGILEMAQMIHRIEGQAVIVAEDFNSIQASLNKILHDNAQLLQLMEETEESVKIPKTFFNKIFETVQKEIAPAKAQDLLDDLRELSYKPIHSYLGPLTAAAEATAAALDKKVQCEIQGDEIRVPENFAGVLRNIIHLVRNSIDHGIETPEERGKKSSTGRISLTFKKAKNHLVVVAEDDGRGLNLDMIKKKALSLGLVTEDELKKMSDQAIARFIFHPNFSTANEVTEISGRGVGMSSVEEAVTQLHGEIDVKSQIGEGTAFILTLPMSA